MADLPLGKALPGFVVANNTATREVKSDPKNRIQVEIGDAKQPDAKPQFKLMRWDNEVNFSVRAQEHPSATVDIVGGVVKYITPDYEVHQYEKPEAGEDGGFEFSWSLLRAPASNRLTATIQTKGLIFEYQGPLSIQDVEQGLYRPPEIIGSYAVYHATKGVWNEATGRAYKTGKFCHIKRPKAIDANGIEAWCDLKIDVESGLLTVTAPQEFLDTAAYPVEVDPTFGYTSKGGTSGWSWNGFINMNREQAPENGTGVSISAFLFPVSSVTAKCNVYQDETGVADVDVALLANGATEEKTINSGDALYTFNFTSPPTFVAGTYYRAAGWSTSSSNGAFSDSTGSGTLYFRALAYGAWPDPSGTLSSNTFRLSMYITYTSAAAPFANSSSSEASSVPPRAFMRMSSLWPRELLTYLDQMPLNLAGKDLFFTSAGRGPSYDWPNPVDCAKRPKFWARENLTYVDALPLNLSGKDVFFAGAGRGPTYDYPNPTRLTFQWQWARENLTSLDAMPLNLAGKDKFFGVAGQPPSFTPPMNPRGYPHPTDLRTWLHGETQQTLYTVVVAAPFALSDWPNPLPPRVAIALRTFIETLKTNLLDQDLFFGAPGQPPQFDPPQNPWGAKNLELRTFLNPTPLKLIGQDVFFGGAGQPPTYQPPPNPWGARRPIELRTHLLSFDLRLLAGQDQFFGAPGEVAPQRDWPNPRGPIQPHDIRSFQHALQLELLGKDQFYGAPGQPPVPRLTTEVHRRTLNRPHLNAWAINLLETTLGGVQVVALPFNVAAWPNPQRIPGQRQGLVMSRAVLDALVAGLEAGTIQCVGGFNPTIALAGGESPTVWLVGEFDPNILLKGTRN